MYVCGCLCVAVCQCAVWSVRWCGGLSWRSKGDAGGMVCHLPRHRIRMISHHLLGGVQNAQTHTHTHIHPHVRTHGHTPMYTNTHTEAWRVEMKYPPHQSYTETWRPRPGDRDHTSDHMTLGYRCTPVRPHTHRNALPHTLARCSLWPFSPNPKPCCALCVISVLIWISVL